MKNTTAVVSVLFLATSVAIADPLPSWSDGPVKQSIVTFVESVSAEGSKNFVPAAERIAVFDNDGTLWAEKPVYFQLLYALDRVRELAPEHPEWQTSEPFRSVLENDLDSLGAQGEHAIVKLIAASHAGMTKEEFAAAVRDWQEASRHPRFDRPFTSLLYQPQLELLDYLRANGFKTFIVSGGGIDFLRTFSEQAYGIPPEQVVGSSLKAQYELRDGKPVIVKQAEIDFIDDKAGKPAGIDRHIGRRPIMAVGNSDGDFEMLEYTKAGSGSRLAVLVHHDDAEREYAYDRESSVGRLVRGLDEADQRDWLVVSMKNDWEVIFPAYEGE